MKRLLGIGSMAPLPAQIIEEPSMVNYTEDWSEVRSPARAARRRKRGFPQRIKQVPHPKTEVYLLGNTYVMHPSVAAEFRRRPIPPSHQTDRRPI